MLPQDKAGADDTSSQGQQQGQQQQQQQGQSSKGKGKKGKLPAEGEEFDISRLAPPVKGQQQ